MRLRYRTIKKPPVEGRITFAQAEKAVRALQEREALKSSKPKLQKRGQNGPSGVVKKTAGKATPRSLKT